MNYVQPLKSEIVARSRADAVALQAFARAIPADSRFSIKAGLYPDASGRGRFKVAVTITRVGLLDGVHASKALREYVTERRTGTVYRGERELPLIGAHE